jgi:hypothetical protein
MGGGGGGGEGVDETFEKGMNDRMNGHNTG